MGWEGVGLYWTFIEILRDCPTYRYPHDLATLELGLSTAQATLEATLQACFEGGLLVLKDGFFGSPSLDRRMADSDAKREILREAGRRGGIKSRQAQATLKPALSHPQAVKERKGKESTTPSLGEVQAYCKERANRVDPEKWLAYYQSNGWRVGKNPMKDWRAAVRTWEKSEFNQAPKPKPAVVI